ncbi:MAG TPA: ABC transporter permease [Thermoanaerobaculia bacterium]|jgi:predicted permease|nr:ABC transporter permease [Thermoanaerobaculia bacterium]
MLMTSLRATVRGFRKSPGFLILTALTLALGIGATAALFTVVNAVLIRPLPYPEPERVVYLQLSAAGMGLDDAQISDAVYLLFRKENKVLEDMGIYWDGAVTLTGGQEPARLGAGGLTPSVFGILRVPPELGRSFVEDDGKPGAEPVAVLSHALWQTRFGGDRKVINSKIQVDGVSRTVVGVMPESFRFPTSDVQLWIPMVIDPAKLAPGNFNYSGVGRLRPGVSYDRATKELSALVWRIPEAMGDNGVSREMIEQAKLAVIAKPLRDRVVGEIERILWVLLGSVGLILLIACANVANLFLVRAESRQREVAVRTAIGASRGEIARVFLGESLGLSVIGGIAGLALAAAGVRFLIALQPQGIPRLEEIGIDATVVTFTALVSILSGLLIGGFAALRYGSPDLVPALKEGGRGGTAGKARHLARQVLVVFQVALALVLLVGAGLMLRSFWRLTSVDPGIDPKGVLTVNLSLPDSEYASSTKTAQLYAQLLEKVRALPGVEKAGTNSVLPLSNGNSMSSHMIEDQPTPPNSLPPMLGTRFASPGYFEALGIPLLEGRSFDRIDPERAEDGVVVSRSLARHFWPNGSALGKRLSPGGPGEPIDKWFTIIGVVGDVREQGLHQKPVEAVYYAVRRMNPDGDGGGGGEWVPRDFALVVKAKPGVDPAGLVDAVRQAVWSIDPKLPLSGVRTMEKVVELSMARTSFTMLLLGIGAAVALLLGAVGIYGVISYIVSQRTQEIGVRMALGAQRGDVSGMVMKEGLLLAVLGIGSGLAVAFAVTRLMKALLYEVSATDPATFAAVPLLLALVALLASYVPARRAAGVQPLEAIRYE